MAPNFILSLPVSENSPSSTPKLWKLTLEEAAKSTTAFPVGIPKHTDALKWKAAVALKLECLQMYPCDHKSLVCIHRPQPDPHTAVGCHMGASYVSDARSQRQPDDISGFTTRSRDMAS